MPPPSPPPSLTSSPVNANDIEGSSLAIWNEFLFGYFDGGTHNLGLTPAVQFPTAVLRYQESPLPQPINAAVGISVVFVRPSKVHMYWDTPTATEAGSVTTTSSRQQRAEAHCAWLFLIRSVSAGSDDNAQKQVQSAGGKLYGLLQNNMATRPLAEKGLSKLRPTPPRMAFPGDDAPTADLGFKLRILSCAATLRYPILSQPD